MPMEAIITAIIAALAIAITYLLQRYFALRRRPKRLPHSGQRFQLKGETKLLATVWYAAPCSTGFHAVLPAGEILKLDYDPDPNKDGIWLVPERYGYFEGTCLDAKIRNDPDYDHYTFGVSYRELERDYEWLDEPSSMGAGQS